MKNNIRFFIGLVGLGFLALSSLAQSASDPIGPRQRSQHLSHLYQWHAHHHDNGSRVAPGLRFGASAGDQQPGAGRGHGHGFVVCIASGDLGRRDFIELPNFDPSSTAIPEEINDAREVVGTELVTL